MLTVLWCQACQQWAKQVTSEATGRAYLTPAGVFKIQPSWVNLLLELSVITEVTEMRGCWGASKVGDDMSGEALHDLGVGGKAALSIGHAGGGSSGLFGGGTTVRGT